MNLEKNYEYAALIKDEYLPPPLEKNYLSLFDIQVKMAKEFLDGTEEEKVSIIKKRIKKFFDYGNQALDNDQQKTKLVDACNKKPEYPRFQADPASIKAILQIDCAKLILYGKDLMNSQIAQQMFAGFVDIQKIDDCNIQLSFHTKEKCQSLLYNNVKDKSTLVSQHICYPTEIQWFELEGLKEDKNQESPTFYARFVTNKDDILFRNDVYFRKLLGKARKMVQQKQLENQQREKEMQQKVQRQKHRLYNKTKMIAKNFHEKKYKKDFDNITNYDGFYTPESFQTSRDSRFFPRDFQRRTSYRKNYQDQRNSRAQKRHFDCLNLSEIRHVPIELQDNQRKDRSQSRRQRFSFSKESLNFSYSKDKHKERQRSKEVCTRDGLIRQYRERQSSPRYKSRGKNLSSYDFDKEYTKKVQKIVSRGDKPRYEID